jgi:transmembrane sensor
MTQSRRRTDTTAALWAVRLSEGSLTAQEQCELDQWLEADVRHRGALLRARAAWLDLDRIAALRGQSQPHDAQRPALSLPGALTNRRWFVAAGLATVGIAGVGALWMRRHADVYVSEVGEIRRVTLADGSVMLLNTASQASVHFDESRREVLLRGEALFEVAKDAARPFVVRAGDVSVRAVGTVFAVRASGQRVDVTVTEGVVEVTDAQAPDEGAIHRVTANEHALIVAQHKVKVQPIHSDQAERRLAWRDGMADFNGESLAEAIEEINRHNHRRIVVDDAALANRPVVGTFRASDAEGFAATVATAFDAQRIDSGDVIHLRPRPPP